MEIRVLLFIFMMLAFIRPAFAVNYPIAYWRFDGDALDYSSGGNNDGTLQGGPVYVDVPGKFGDALEFDGTDDYVSVASPDALFSFANPATVSFWVKADDYAGNNWLGPLTLKTDGAQGFGFNITDYSAACSGVIFGTAPMSIVTVSDISAMFLNNWRHVVVTYDGAGHVIGSYRLYVDGQSHSIESSTCLGASVNVTKIGVKDKTSGADEFFDGMIDDVRIYNRALSEEEIQALYALPPLVDCTAPDAREGVVLYNEDQNVPQYCDGMQWVAMARLNPAAGGSGCTSPAAPEGVILYNSDAHVPQFCDGDDWIAMGGGFGPQGDGSGLSGPSGCANIGDLCADGTVFAGYHPVTQAHLFIPTADQERPGSPGTFTMNWKNATGTDDINPDSDNDGEVNHANRGGTLADFQAFQACEDLTFGGQTDWYLPSRVELYYLWSVHGTIEAGGNITNFQNAVYWGSTEDNTVNAWCQVFTNGGQCYNDKFTGYRVRCVRR